MQFILNFCPRCRHNQELSWYFFDTKVIRSIGILQMSCVNNKFVMQSHLHLDPYQYFGRLIVKIASLFLEKSITAFVTFRNAIYKISVPSGS